MKRLHLHLMVAALTAMFAIAGAHAADMPPPPPADDEPSPPGGWGPPDGHGGHRWRPRMFGPHLELQEFDANKDGRISHAEIDQVLRARFDAADANHDGQLDAAEFASMHFFFQHRVPPPDGEGPDRDHRFGPPHPPEPGEIIKHLDWNLDGKISFEEFAAPIRQMALRLDRDGDGVIEGDELRGPEFGPPPPPGAPPLPPPPPRD